MLELAEGNSVLAQEAVITAEVVQYLQMLLAVKKYLVVMLSVDIYEHSAYLFQQSRRSCPVIDS